MEILRPVCSNGTLTNNNALLKRKDAGAARPPGANDLPLLNFDFFNQCLLLNGGGEPMSLPHSPPLSHVFAPQFVNFHHCTILCFYDNAVQIICTGVSTGSMCAWSGGGVLMPAISRKAEWTRFLLMRTPFRFCCKKTVIFYHCFFF